MFYSHTTPGPESVKIWEGRMGNLAYKRVPCPWGVPGITLDSCSQPTSFNQATLGLQTPNVRRYDWTPLEVYIWKTRTIGQFTNQLKLHFVPTCFWIVLVWILPGNGINQFVGEVDYLNDLLLRTDWPSLVAPDEQILKQQTRCILINKSSTPQKIVFQTSVFMC